MIAGPQILSAIFLATSEGWRRNSAAYILGAGISISLVVTAAFLLGRGARDQGASNEALYVVVLVLLLLAMLRTYLRREEAETPKWMGTLQTATPALSFKLGMLLLGIFPTDILTSVAVGSYLAGRDDPLWHAVPFVLLTLTLLAVPALMLLALGERAERVLPKARDWMNDNSWVVNELVLALFVGITISNLAG